MYRYFIDFLIFGNLTASIKYFLFNRNMREGLQLQFVFQCLIQE